MNVSNPLVSIIIPTYNRSKYVGRAIASAQNQLYKNIEIIVIDDGSTDNTAEIIQQFENVHYYYKNNGRQASARNAGLKIAKGDFICTLDSDDYWHPNFLSESISQIVAHDLDFVFSNSYKENEKSNKKNLLGILNYYQVLKMYFESEKYLHQRWILFEYEEIRKIYTETCIAPSSSLVFKKDAIVGNWDERILVADDWEFVMRILLSKKCKIGFCKEPLWTKYIVENNVYESLNSIESVKYILVHDFKIMIKNNYHNFRSSEIEKLNQHRVNSCFNVINNMINNRNIKGCVTFLYLSFKCSAKKTVIKIFNINYLKLGKKIIIKMLRQIKSK